jgi:hypothetical protein
MDGEAAARLMRRAGVGGHQRVERNGRCVFFD